jgi:hypothetical protein
VNLSDVRDVTIRNSTISSSTGIPVVITDGQEVTVDSVSFTVRRDSVLQVVGAKSRNIKLRNTPIRDLVGSVIFGTDAPKDAVLIEN